MDCHLVDRMASMWAVQRAWKMAEMTGRLMAADLVAWWARRKVGQMVDRRGERWGLRLAFQ